MVRKIFKWFAITSAVVSSMVVVLLIALILCWPSGNSDRLVTSERSPDGHVTAEMHAVITPMWGGADRLEIRLRKFNQPTGEVVYSRMFECGDFSAFNTHWLSPKNLDITLGHCDSGIHDGVQSDMIVWTKLPAWNGIDITYTDAGRSGNQSGR